MCSIFKRNNVYYVIHGNLCCFCERGSDAKVLASKSPLGPYRFITNLNNLLPSKDHIKAQSSGIVTVREYDGTYKYIWTGDMWFSSKSGYKGDDFQYFQPLQFKAEGANSDGIDIPYRSPLWEDCFELRLKTNLQRMHNGGNSYVNTYCNDISGSKQTSQNSMATDHAGSKNDL